MHSTHRINQSFRPIGGAAQTRQLKILLQDRDSRLYLQAAQQWTSNREEALDFQNSARASGFVLQGRLPNIDIILSFPDSKYDVRIPCSLPSHHLNRQAQPVVQEEGSKTGKPLSMLSIK
jgi:hypothetical protein